MSVPAKAASWLILVSVIAGCGGETAGAGTHVDVSSDASAGGSRSGTGAGGSTSNGGSSSSLVACNDGTGNADCCPSSAVEGGTCDVNIPRCSRGGCHGGFTSYLYCGVDGVWIAGHGLIPCSVDGGTDGSVSQMSCSELHTAWTSFWGSHEQCTADADCTTFEAIAPGWSPCDAPPGLNRVLNGKFGGEAQLYADRYFQLTCGGDQVTRPNARTGLWSDFGYDGTALVNPRCVSGLCSADSLQCNTPPPFDGGAVGTKDAGSDGAPGSACPGTAGPSMVRVPAPDGSTYCIDSTEVTNRQYAEFLSAKKSGADGGTDTSGQLLECSWNATYTPFSKWPATGRDEFPVVYVDWCDASAYCKWAGKRLCGKIGGGSNAEADFADPAKSQWFNACSQGGTETYPYGSVAGRLDPSKSANIEATGRA